MPLIFSEIRARYSRWAVTNLNCWRFCLEDEQLPQFDGILRPFKDPNLRTKKNIMEVSWYMMFPMPQKAGKLLPSDLNQLIPQTKCLCVTFPYQHQTLRTRWRTQLRPQTPTTIHCFSGRRQDPIDPFGQKFLILNFWKSRLYKFIIHKLISQRNKKCTVYIKSSTNIYLFQPPAFGSNP